MILISHPHQAKGHPRLALLSQKFHFFGSILCQYFKNNYNNLCEIVFLVQILLDLGRWATPGTSLTSPWGHAAQPLSRSAAQPLSPINRPAAQPLSPSEPHLLSPSASQTQPLSLSASQPLSPPAPHHSALSTPYLVTLSAPQPLSPFSPSAPQPLSPWPPRLNSS